MPGTTKIFTASTGLVAATSTIPADTGQLISAAVEIGTSAALSSKTYVRIGVFRQEGTGGSVGAILTQGYVGFLSQLGWDGRIPLSPNMQVFAQVRSFATVEIRFSIITEASRKEQRSNAG